MRVQRQMVCRRCRFSDFARWRLSSLLVGLDGPVQIVAKRFFGFAPPVMATREKGARTSEPQGSPACLSGM
jgi:hypothetical protein